MDDGGFEIEQKIMIFRVILCNFYNFPGKCFDRFEIFPEGKSHKMSDRALTPFQDMDAEITFHRLIVCDGTRIQEFAIGAGFCGWHLSMPHSRDHFTPPRRQTWLDSP